MKLDKMDYAVLSELREDSRITYKDLAKKLDSNINTVASRIKRLEKNGYILGYSANIDYDKVGFKTSALVKLILDNADSLDAEALKDILSLPDTVFVCRITGPHDLDVMVKAKNFDELIERISRLGKNKHVVCIKSEFVVKEYKVIDDFNPLSAESKRPEPFKKRKKPLDELDLGILRELRQGADKPLRVLSEKLKAPISTIKERTDRMEYNGIIRNYVARINFPKLGYWGYGMIAIKLNSSFLNNQEVVDRLLEIPGIGTLFRTLGSHDLHAGFLAKGNDNALDIVKRASSIPGVQKAEPHIGLSMFKSRAHYNPLSDFKMEHEN